jgi:hypothetical protein
MNVNSAISASFVYVGNPDHKPPCIFFLNTRCSNHRSCEMVITAT